MDGFGIIEEREDFFFSRLINLPNDFIIQCFRITEMVILLHTNED